MRFSPSPLLMALFFVSLLCAGDLCAEEADKDLLLSPKPGKAVKENPFQLKGRAHQDLDRFTLESQAWRAEVRVQGPRFKVPIYLWANADGESLPVQLSATPSFEARTLEYLAPSHSLEELEARLGELVEGLKTQPLDHAPQILELAQKLVSGGHPIFASVALIHLSNATDRFQSLPLEQQLEAHLLSLTLSVVLEDLPSAMEHLSALSKLQLASRKMLRDLGEELFLLSDLALIQGLKGEFAIALLEQGNLRFEHAGLLPRRLLLGY